MYAINLSWEQSNDTLLWAMQEKAHLRTTVRLAREWTEMPSEFIGGELLKTLVIKKFPSPWTQRMLSGQLLPCSFRKGQRKYLFVSAIIDCTKVVIDGSEVETYVLAWPEGLQQVQRRLYFRAAVPPDMKLSVNIWHSSPAVAGIPSTPPIETGRLIDISAGGTQIEISSASTLEMDKSYLLEIELPKPELAILAQAQARRVQAIPTNGTYSFGLQFLSLDHSPRGQETLLRLARFSNYLRSLMPSTDVNHDVI
jgi:c-di-GMP-binding flagellar brake protein YcgR